MEGLLEILKPHASWLFGSGGVAAAILSFLKLFKGGDGKKSGAGGEESPQQSKGNRFGNVSAGGDFVGGNKVTTTGFGGLEVALIVAMVVCLGGLGLMFAGDTVVAGNGSAAVQGDGNKTSVTTTTPKE